MSSPATPPPPAFARVFHSGVRDDRGQLLGGTEVLHLVAHRGRLFSSLSHKLHAEQPGDPPVGSQIAVLDHAAGRWQLDHEYDRAQWRVTLESVTFTQDGHGRALAQPVPLLLAGPSDNRGPVYVDSRDDRTGTWTRTHLGTGASAGGIRSFFVYRDKVTGQERVFAGSVPIGLFSGTYDPDAPGQIRWDPRPELDGYNRRPMAFAECNGRLYTTIKPDMYRRIDGPSPRWEKVYTILGPLIVPSSGLRGLTAVPRPGGGGQVLLATLEGDRCRLVRIDPEDGFRETVELEVLDLLGERWGSRPTYGVVAYDDFTPVVDPSTGQMLLLAGLGATYSTKTDWHPPDAWVEDAWYLIRYPDGRRHGVRRIETPASEPRPILVAVRSIAVSPFEPGTLYFGGYDPNARPARDTAWVYSAPVAAALGANVT
jgi:poly(A) polymerase